MDRSTLHRLAWRPGATRRVRVGALAALVMVAGCASDGEDIARSTSATVSTSATATLPDSTVPATTAPPTAPATTSPPTSATTTVVATEPPPATPLPEPALDLLTTLADDELQGRDNTRPESGIVRDLLVERLSQFAQPWHPTGGPDGYLQPFDVGTNVIGIIPGTDLADEYVMVGAHYDHLAPGDCRLVTTDDDICNGAVDNATGVVATMAIAETIAAEAPRRSVIVAFWDAEEDGLLGSRAFVASPAVPLDRIVTYVNFDMQGSRLLPSLADRTVAVGAETGGDALAGLAREVTAASSLDYANLSLIMGQGRSDHAPLAAAGVPVVFFTDATNGCYHSVDDELDAVDLDKLGAQIVTVTDLVQRLANDDLAIAFDATAPLTSFADAEQLLDLARTGLSDLALLDAATADTADQIVATIDAVVAAGPDAYDDAAAGAVLGAAAQLVDLLTTLDCALGIPS